MQKIKGNRSRAIAINVISISMWWRWVMTMPYMAKPILLLLFFYHFYTDKPIKFCLFHFHHIIHLILSLSFLWFLFIQLFFHALNRFKFQLSNNPIIQYEIDFDWLCYSKLTFDEKYNIINQWSPSFIAYFIAELLLHIC